MTHFPKKIKNALIYTMNATEEQSKMLKYDEIFQRSAMINSVVFGSKTEILPCYNTLQVTNYSNYVMDIFDPKDKKESRKTQFPKDLEKAFKLGQKLVE